LKTLVTGATGFIGTHLVKALVEKGRDVRCLVRKTSNTTYLKKLGVELVYGDLLDRDSLKGIVKGVNIVYHLAGEVYSKRTSDYYKVNVDGTKNLLEACLPEKIKKFIYLSSISAVGPNPKQGILLNEKSPCKPITPYGKSKYLVEKLVSMFSKKYTLPATIIRLPTVYGPGVSTSSRVFTMLELIKRGLFRIIGNGNNVISLCYIDNLINGILLIDRKTQNTNYTIYFLADQKPRTIREIAEKIAMELDTKVSRFYIPVWVANIAALVFPAFKKWGNKFPTSLRDMIREIPNSWACDISKARQELKYDPMVDFNEGIRRTVIWYKEKYG